FIHANADCLLMKTFSRSPGSTPQILLPLIETAGFCLAMVALWLVAVEATAATKTWDGSSSGNWGTDANWTGGVAPAPGDDLVFPAGVSRFNVTNNIGLLPLRSLTFTGSNYVLRGVGIILTNGITAGHASKTNTIELDISTNASQTFTVTSGGVLEILGDLALNGASLTISNSSNTRLA